MQNTRVFTTGVIPCTPADSTDGDLYLEEFDQDSFYPAFRRDLRQARALVIIHSPYLGAQRIKFWMSEFLTLPEREVSLSIITEKPRNWDMRLDRTLEPAEALRLKQTAANVQTLESLPSHVTMRPNIHQKIVAIDDDILWFGSMNVLSHYDTRETMWRLVCHQRQVASIKRNALDQCDQCNTRTGLFEGTSMFDGLSPKMLAKLLASKREQSGLSQAELAEFAGVSQRAISYLETGKHTNDADLLFKLCAAFELQLLPVPKFMVPAVKNFIERRIQK